MCLFILPFFNSYEKISLHVLDLFELKNPEKVKKFCLAAWL